MLNPNGTVNAVGGESTKAKTGSKRARPSRPRSEMPQATLVKVEEHPNKVGRSERTGAIIEPRLSMQWFVAMEELAKPALDRVMDDTIQFHPAKFKNSYRNWMENVKDWCISRQLWWGHRIPAWYYEGEPTSADAKFVVAADAETASKLATEAAGRPIAPTRLATRRRRLGHLVQLLALAHRRFRWVPFQGRGRLLLPHQRLGHSS